MSVFTKFVETVKSYASGSKKQGSNTTFSGEVLDRIINDFLDLGMSVAEDPIPDSRLRHYRILDGGSPAGAATYVSTAKGFEVSVTVLK